jgi:predicted RNA binding protein YcfA (HicA-like mRNA interferase family)
MSYKEVRRALLDEGCFLKSTRGSHEKWVCPCGSHQTVVPKHRVVSPGVVRDVIVKLDCLPKGWLQ